jgi:hypothetical protein
MNFKDMLFFKNNIILLLCLKIIIYIYLINISTISLCLFVTRFIYKYIIIITVYYDNIFDYLKGVRDPCISALLLEFYYKIDLLVNEKIMYIISNNNYTIIN